MERSPTITDAGPKGALSTETLDSNQCLALPVAPNLHRQYQHQHNRPNRYCKRKGYIPVGKRKVGRNVFHL